MASIRIASALAALALLPAAAQAQSTITACYVPKSGSVYRIKVEGTPTKCAQNHVEFTWTSGASTTTTYFPSTFTNAWVIQPGVTTDLTLSCAASQDLVTGGYIKYGPDTPNVEIVASSQNGTADTWLVRVTNHGTDPSQVGLFLRCFELLQSP
jgi:hypothetical protein